MPRLEQAYPQWQAGRPFCKGWRRREGFVKGEFPADAGPEPQTGVTLTQLWR